MHVVNTGQPSMSDIIVPLNFTNKVVAALPPRAAYASVYAVIVLPSNATVGVVSASFSFSDVLRGAVPANIDGMVAVLVSRSGSFLRRLAFVVSFIQPLTPRVLIASPHSTQAPRTRSPSMAVSSRSHRLGTCTTCGTLGLGSPAPPRSAT